MACAIRILSSALVACLLAVSLSACNTSGGKPNVQDEVAGDAVGQANEGE